ncbi:beta-galactosidase-1-like protein 3 [Fukomys damarensis]|uniref:beta-galactosidase-1-like protein 3 n=1 Tax=Fukomys damarensis TaxID=885580 RepID=UPI0008FED0B5|nr:beta-galactosidase-1-like protein 3 [Fukomys damarensis]
MPPGLWMDCPTCHGPTPSLCVSWKGILGVCFLPLILPHLATQFGAKGNLKSGNAKVPLSRFNWSSLTPPRLQHRSLGLRTASTTTGRAHFTLEGHKFLIFGGSIHYFRVPRQYWRDRLLKLKACGFNTVTTYIPWNLHETERGRLDFSGNLDLEAFVLLAAEIGLWVILRPGPYICAEIDLGGLPSWLLQDPKTQLRTTEKSFVDAVDKYFDQLIPRMLPLQYQQGGPVIAVQVENEYGSFNKDKHYMAYLKEALLKRGIVELLLTCDHYAEVMNGSIKGVLATVNLDSLRKDSFHQLLQVQINKPILVMEYWVGWFDNWGRPHSRKSVLEVESTVSSFIKHEISFNLYMFHGGTNFGFMNAAGSFDEKHIGVVTSYDYDALLTEAGDYTEKYFKLRKLLGTASAIPLPPLPDLTLKTVYPSVRPSLYLPLWDVLQYLGEPMRLHIPVNMENLPVNNGSGQSFGFVLYETSICSAGQLHAPVYDTAQVFLNETLLGFLHEDMWNLDIPTFRGCGLLRILVENQGRIDFSWKIQDERKGLVHSVCIDGVYLKGFTIYSLEMKMSFFERLRSATWRPVSEKYVGPAFYQGTLRAGYSPRDTFLSLLSWHRGFVFINGYNLGRYWKIGPQKTLYLPGVWLHPGPNEIILFEMMTSGSYIQSKDEPQLE